MDRKEYVSGLISGASAFTIWGLLPIYWKWLGEINPYQIFGQRVIWSVLFVVIVMGFKGQLGGFLALARQPQEWRRTLGPAFFISVNWIVFLWSVNNGYVVEASLGYYINPLVLAVFGAIYFHERMDRYQIASLVLAGIGVLVKTVAYGRLPWIALTLACSFGTYGLLKKKSPHSSLMGLGLETLVIGVPGLLYILFVETQGMGITGNLPPSFWLRVSTTGAVTAIPLLLYAEGTKRLPLNVVGFLQYIGPTLMLILGVFLFGETFDLASWISFGFIWLGLVLFSYSQYRLLTPAGKRAA